MRRLTYASTSVEAEILPDIGARLHRLRAFGHDLLRTPDDDAAYEREPFFWGCYVMAPWCNRIEATPVNVGARGVHLGANYPDGSAIHGQVYRHRWEPSDDGTFHVHVGGDGWPWDYEVTQRIEVADRWIRLDHTLTNRSPDRMPAGIGIHPWFRRPVLISIRGDAVYDRNSDTPAQPDPVSGSFDLRELREIPDGLDATWAELAQPPVRLRWPRVGVQATMSVSAPDVYIVAASPSGLDAIAVEPQTHVPQGLRRLLNHEPGALTMLESGRSLRMGVELAFAQWPG